MELFGTDEPPPERRELRAGALSVVFEDGNLRTICYGGVEVIRAVNYLARDAAWGTLKPELSDLTIAADETSFSVRYSGLCGSEVGGLRYEMRISGNADGSLTMEADAVALADFTTNRTGFVVLHPSGAAGAELTIRHTDGGEERTALPKQIMADQPAFDIAALTYEPAPGLSCTVSMEGEAFEMEDQRNWADASFKTYVRPLSKPRPYVIARGERDRQRIVIGIRGRPAGSATVSEGRGRLTLGKRLGHMPASAVFVDDAMPETHRLPEGMLRALVVRIDPSDDAHPSALAEAAALARSAGASLALEVVMDARNPLEEAEAVMRRVRAAGASAAALLVSPRREFKSRPSNTLPDGEHPVGVLVDAIRCAGFAGRIGAGTPSYFTEFNRNPPSRAADFVFFSVAATVHAADDLSVMETLDVFPDLVSSARALCPSKAVWLGPCTIGVRHNPYGADVQPNPSGGRVASARFDPRHARLFGAAYAVGIAAQAAASQVDTLCIAALAGPFGLFNDDGSRRPIATVQAELTAAAGASCFSLDGNGVKGVAYETSGGLRGLAANTTAQDVELLLSPPFETAVLVQSDGGTAGLPFDAGRIMLAPYRTVILS